MVDDKLDWVGVFGCGLEMGERESAHGQEWEWAKKEWK